MNEISGGVSQNAAESKNGFEENYESIQKHNVELSNIKSEIIKKSIAKINSESFQALFKSALPSFLLLILSFFIGVSDIPVFGNIFNSIAKFISPDQPLASTDIHPVDLWWFPFLTYLIFIVCAIRANASIKREIQLNGASEASITRIIDRYSGIVDGIGTALPLLGAAILLISIEKGPAIFLGFAVPFEIKSIIILAIAKLFDSVFDALALRYQEVQEEIKNAEKVYYYQKQAALQKGIIEKIIPQSGFPSGPIEIRTSITEDQLRRMHDTMISSEKLGISIKNLITEINNLRLPDERILRELEQTSKIISETVSSLKDSNVLRSLDNLAYLSGKR
ncbi:MAG: hypothetical protein HGGPFJEG_01473 [Ignavibacteria bacterium]|nr:hypothetical protein [Ignavibacteria bacterium]